MKLIFMGTPDFAVPSLKELLGEGYEISSVVTVPDKKQGRGLKTAFSPVKEFALENNLRLIQPDNLLDTGFISEIKKQNPDLIIVVAFRILPKVVFNIPKLGTINLHASLLPRYRGAAPINWAIIKGETETGLTTFFINEKVDTGNVILQIKVPIEPFENYGSLYSKMSQEGAKLLLETVKKVSGNDYQLINQDESIATPAPKIFKENCNINWNQEAIKIHNFIRGLSPNPCAFTVYDNKILKIFESRISDQKSNSKPGELYLFNKNIFVNTNDFLIEILEIQLEGKKRLKSSEFINSITKGKKIILTSN